MLDPNCKDQDTLALIRYIAEEDKLEKILENPQVIKTPVVRNGKQSTLGYQPDVWKKDENGKKAPKALAQVGAFAAGVGVAAAAGFGMAAALVPVAGASAAMGITKGLNKIQVHKKVKDQQYRALSVILYIEGLQEFLEG